MRVDTYGVGRRKRTAIVAGMAMLVVAVAVAGYYLASPLWRSTEVQESRPFITGQRPHSSEAIMLPLTVDKTEVTTFSALPYAGEFMGADDFHFGKGQAQIIQTAPGRYTLRFEDFAVRNGPDLFVYLSPNPNGYSTDATSLGRLRADRGSFNYEIPADTDIGQVRSVVIWCRQFSVLFAWATLRET